MSLQPRGRWKGALPAEATEWHVERLSSSWVDVLAQRMRTPLIAALPWSRGSALAQHTPLIAALP